MATTARKLDGPAKLLGRVRQLLQKGRDPQKDLDQMVQAIASSLRADVCSLYLLREEKFELYASKGLKNEAIHKLRLNKKEGLVGYVARSARALNLAEAAAHPSFAFKPETGEEEFSSFLGVPMIRRGTVLGVLVLQNKKALHYPIDEVEALQTVAMVISEIVASPEFSSQLEKNALLKAVPFGAPDEKVYFARSFAEGLAMGPVISIDQLANIGSFYASDNATEREKLEKGLSKLADWIDEMMNRSLVSGETREVLETYRMFSNDKGWRHRLIDGINSGLTAAGAIRRARNLDRARLEKSADPYLRDRLHDLEDLDNRLLRFLQDGNKMIDTKGKIVVARHLGPAEVIEYGAQGALGFILEEGGAGSHAAVVARALGLPMIGRVVQIFEHIEAGDFAIVDALDGRVITQPGAPAKELYRNKIELRSKYLQAFEDLKDQPAQSRDGKIVDLQMNAGLLLDLDQLDICGAHSVGLFRTEFHFMAENAIPSLKSQIEFYRNVYEHADGRMITFRTVDLGGDKLLPYLFPEREENPELGWRGLRIGLDKPAILRYQLRAMLAAAGTRPLKIMFPLVATCEEFLKARAMFNIELKRLKRFSHPFPTSIELGVMIEAPSIIYQLEELCQYAQFLSIGLNDLMQFFFAADRGNAAVADRYSVMSPPALRLLRDIQRKVAQTNCELSICGEAAGRPCDALILSALGYEILSMSAASVGPVKAAIRAFDLDALAAELNQILDKPGGSVNLFLARIQRKLNKLYAQHQPSEVHH